MKIKLFFTALLGLSLLSSCKVQLPANEPIAIRLDSEPRGAKVVFDGRVICESTPATVNLNVPVNAKEKNLPKLTFILPGYKTGEETLSFRWDQGRSEVVWQDAVFHQFTAAAAQPVATTTQKPKTEERVTRENPGSTKMEDAIIRWYFDSDPRGARIFWRVISNVPSEVKNTNETYLTSTPYEETRSFNILGLTYANSKDVTIEIKVTKRGYVDQVKRFNVRQALDQQEISGFFEMVPKDE